MLQVKDLSFSFDETQVLSGISFSINQGTYLAVIGESGSGKSTLLKLLYGIYDPNKGTIFYHNEKIVGPKFQLIPGHKDFQYLSQDFGLMPFATVTENVGVYLSNTNMKEKQTRVNELLTTVEMIEFSSVKVKNLSGGQQQRVAIAKALAPKPSVLLLDEPFSQIDVFRSSSLRRNLFNYLKENKVTCVTATHCSDDVLSFADEVLVLKNGIVVDHRNPLETYRNPISKYTAGLFGEVNEIPNKLLTLSNSSDEGLLVYPHNLCVVASSPLPVVVKRCYFRGGHYLIEAQAIHGVVFFEHSVLLEIGVQVYLSLKNERHS